MKKLFCIVASAALLCSMAWAGNERAETLERVTAAAKVMDEIMAAPDKGIPGEILSGAECVAVIPGMKKGGFVFGGRYGKGVATCRTAKGWSAPAPLMIGGGSWGLQIGAEEVDLVMLVMNQEGMRNLLSSKFKVGADASAAAGPVGRDVEGSTDWKMRSQILTYSRARGAFAGITLNGAVIKQDEDDTRAFYGRMVPFRTILTGGVAAPNGSEPFLATVRKYFVQARASERAEGSSPRKEPAAGGTSARTGTAGGTSGTVSSGSATSTTQRSETSGSVAGSAQGETRETRPGATTTEAAGTADVKGQIEAALRNEPSLSSANVVVKVNDDSVELSGSVPTQNDKAVVRRIAQSKAGNRRVVDDQLFVK